MVAVKIAVLGGTGWLGGTIVSEALARGHEVTAIARNPEKLAQLDGVATVAADATDVDEVAGAIAGHDAVIAAVTDRSGPDRTTIPAAARALIEAVARAGVPRVLFVGGGGSLSAPGAEGRYLDQADFPEQYKTEALAGAEALALFRAAPEALHWAYLSPPPHFLEPGEKTGSYRVQGGDQPVLDEHGEGRISAGDLAAAMLDEVEQDRFARQRFTVGY